MPRRLALPLALSLWACSADPPVAVEDVVSPRDSVFAADRALSDQRAPALTTLVETPDIVVTLPFGGPAQSIPLESSSAPALVDVHLLVDTTASFDGEIRELQREVLTTLLPALRQRVSGLTVGVSRFEDMPYLPFGAETDRPFALLTAQTTDTLRVQSAVGRLDQPLGNGADLPESWAEALFQVATGQGLALRGTQGVSAFRTPATGGGRLGGVGFRERSTRVVVLVTDAIAHTSADYARAGISAHSLEQAITALRAMSVHVVGVVSSQNEPAVRSSLESVALQTGAVAPARAGVCSTGLRGATRAARDQSCPLVYDVAPDGSGLSRTVVDGIFALLDTLAYESVHGESDNPQGFVRAIEAVSSRTVAGGAEPTREDRLPSSGPDGIADTFARVAPATTLNFAIRLQNNTVREGLYPQSFLLRVRLVGDAMTLREYVIRVIVPEGPKWDAGVGQDSATDATMDSPHEAETHGEADADAIPDVSPDSVDDAIDAVSPLGDGGEVMDASEITEDS
ncbi:MAG: hypothetical protein Q8Q09_14425 [Deltaproteobacteria bacterium]|nr:hypothetical protein [Deltaproteobacteria bacterium]